MLEGLSAKFIELFRFVFGKSLFDGFWFRGSLTCSVNEFDMMVGSV